MVTNSMTFNEPLRISTIQLELNNGKKKEIGILRLDQIHEKISGNKWFKLKYNLHEAITKQAAGVVSFGGAYSNHLHALAYAGKK